MLNDGRARLVPLAISRAAYLCRQENGREIAGPPARHRKSAQSPETVADSNESDPCAVLQETDLLTSMDEWLDDLSIKHREVLTRRFGLRGLMN